MMNWKSYIHEAAQFILSKDGSSNNNSLDMKKKVRSLTNYLKKSYIHLLRMDTSSSTEKGW